MKARLSATLILLGITTCSISAYAAPAENIVKEEDIDEYDSLDSEVIDVMNLASSEVNNCQLTIRAELPDGFDGNCYCQIFSEKTGAIYNFPLYYKNDFSQRGFIPDGAYRVNEIGIYGDVNGSFRFKPVDDFELMYGEMTTIAVSLENEQEAIDLIASRLMTEEGSAEESVYAFSDSDYDFTHKGNGAGHISATGTPSSAYALVIKITKAGTPGDMMIAYSIDDGVNYSEPEKIPLTGKWSLDGISYIFEVPVIENENGSVTSGSFAEGDTYRHVFWDPLQIFEYDNPDGAFEIKIYDDNPDKNPYITARETGFDSILIRILKTGVPGKAIYQYSLNSGPYSDQMYVPESGTIHLGDTSMYLMFEQVSSSKNELMEDEIYSARIPREKINSLYILIIFLAAILGGLSFAVYLFFKKQIVSPCVYVIHEYEPVRRNTPRILSPDKPRKGKKNN